MANIPLQSITFPGLSDKYTTPTVDATLTQTGAAADAKKTGDEIGAIKNDLSEKADKSEALSAYIVETETGSIASFSDGADDVPVKDLQVNIEPVQDLHGYDNPWPAGGGKNKLPDVSRESSGYAVTVKYQGNSVTLTGTANSSGGRNVFKSEYFTLKAGTYYFKNFNVNTNGKATPGIYIQNDTTILSDGGQFTLSSDSTKMNIGLNVDSGSEYNYYALFVVATEDITSYAPYSNICPISGWTGANVTACGVNVWDEEWEVGSISNDTGNPEAYGTNRIRSKNYIKVVPNMAYCFYNGSQVNVVVYKYDADKQYLGYEYAPVGTKVFTIPSSCSFLKFRTENNYGATYSHDISINYPATDTDYHAYNGSSVSIDWTTEAGTVYGGTLDVTTGVLTVDRAINTITGSENWIHNATGSGISAFVVTNTNVVSINANTDTELNVIANNLDGKSANDIVNNRQTYEIGIITNQRVMITVPITVAETAEEIKAWLALNNVTFCYKLATPQAYQLTPQEVKTVLGQNNIFADCGNVTVQYRADTKLYIDKVLNA